MQKQRKLLSKEYLSIQTIGKQKFWLGIAAGIIVAVCTSLFTNYLREIYRLLGILNENILILEQPAILFFNYFFAALSTIFGLSIAIYLWLNSPFSLKKSRRERIFSQFAQINAILPVMLTLFLIARFGITLSDLMFNQPLYDNHLNLYEEYWYLFVFLIVFLFYQPWATIQLIYKSGKWILLSLLCCTVSTFILVQTTTVNQNKLNTIYLKQHEDVHTYIDKELSRVKNEYNIEYDKKTIDALKKYFTESAIDLTHSLQSAFESKHKLPLDTIILQKIVIHTFKNSWNIYERYFWDYAYPEDVFYQIQLHNHNSQEVKELMLIFKEEIDLVNTPAYSWEEMKNKTLTERKRNSYVIYNLPKHKIGIPLAKIRDSLLRDEHFSSLAFNLPKIIDSLYNPSLIRADSLGFFDR